MLLPLYVFTLVFIVGPLVYMVILSFLQRAETWGVTNQFTLDNYRNILEPVYLQTFVESFKLAIISTVLIDTCIQYSVVRRILKSARMPSVTRKVKTNITTQNAN